MIIADHLKNAGYDYSLSVFVPEAHIESSTTFRPYEILQLIGVSHADLASPSVEKFLKVSQVFFEIYRLARKWGKYFIEYSKSH